MFNPFRKIFEKPSQSNVPPPLPPVTQASHLPDTSNPASSSFEEIIRSGKFADVYGVDPQKMLAKLKRMMRSAYFPQTKDADGALDDSKFSGLPWLSENESWPICKICGKAMQLFLQLNLATLPERPHEYPSQGLIQVFFCTTGDSSKDCNYYEIQEGAILLRLINPKGNGKIISINPVENPYPPKLIISWENRKEYPNFRFIDDVAEDLTDAEEEGDYWFSLQGEVENSTWWGGDKLLGEPKWSQEPVYPECPICGKPRKYLFQIDSESNLPYVFGDADCAHITQCPSHPEQLTITVEMS